MNHILNQQLRQKKEAITKAVDEHNFPKYIWLHEKPYRLQALWSIERLLTPDEYWPLFAEVWCNVENHWQNKDIIPRMVKAKPRRYELIMTDEERDILAQCDDTLTVYRGYQLCNAKGWSWTFSPSKAEWFAKRFSLSNKWAVAQGQVLRGDVVAFFNRCGENEIVVNPKNVRPIRGYSPRLGEREEK